MPETPTPNQALTASDCGMLLPCPFCGGEGGGTCSRGGPPGGGGTDFVECERCGASGPREPKPFTGSAWNRRLASPAPAAAGGEVEAVAWRYQQEMPGRNAKSVWRVTNSPAEVDNLRDAGVALEPLYAALSAPPKPPAEDADRRLRYLTALHQHFLNSAPEHYRGCGLWVDVEHEITSTPDVGPKPPEAEVLAGAVEAWAELAKRPSWEISFNGMDDEDGWSVHSVTGGVNDREWEELSCADTPLEAILAALSQSGARGGVK